MISGSFGQPGAHFGVLVGRVIVQDQMDVQIGGCFPINQAQKGQEFIVAMTLTAFSDDTSGGQVQGGKQGRGAMSYIIVRVAFRVGESRRESRLRTVQGLNLAFLVYT